MGLSVGCGGLLGVQKNLAWFLGRSGWAWVRVAVGRGVPTVDGWREPRADLPLRAVSPENRPGGDWREGERALGARGQGRPFLPDLPRPAVPHPPPAILTEPADGQRSPVPACTGHLFAFSPPPAPMSAHLVQPFPLGREKIVVAGALEWVVGGNLLDRCSGRSSVPCTYGGNSPSRGRFVPLAPALSLFHPSPGGGWGGVGTGGRPGWRRWANARWERPTAAPLTRSRAGRNAERCGRTPAPRPRRRQGRRGGGSEWDRRSAGWW